jgi:hypothetical protein
MASHSQPVAIVLGGNQATYLRSVDDLSDSAIKLFSRTALFPFFPYIPRVGDEQHPRIHYDVTEVDPLARAL